jgi:hypothetical protein
LQQCARHGHRRARYGARQMVLEGALEGVQRLRAQVGILS